MQSRQIRMDGTFATVPAGGPRLPSRAVRTVPRWGVVSSAVAPVLLVGGWTVAARRGGATPGWDAQALWPLTVVLSCYLPSRAVSGSTACSPSIAASPS